MIKNDIVKEKIREIKADSSRTKARINYEDYTNSERAKATGGAILEANLDISNPICFGCKSRKISLYRNNNNLLKPSNIAANTVMKYTENPWIYGYVHKETLKKISNLAGNLVTNEGSGRVILYSDNPNFGGTWFATNKLFLNALFFG